MEYVLVEDTIGLELKSQCILTLTKGTDVRQNLLKTPFSDYFHFPDQSTENSTKLYEKIFHQIKSLSKQYNPPCIHGNIQQ